MNDGEAIETAISEFVSAYNANNVERMLAGYSDDLIKLRNGAPPETKPETARGVTEVFERFHSRVDVVTDEIRAFGEVGFTRGSFRVALTPKAGGDSQIVERRYLEIWRKERAGGRWRARWTMHRRHSRGRDLRFSEFRLQADERGVTAWPLRAPTKE